MCKTNKPNKGYLEWSLEQASVKIAARKVLSSAHYVEKEILAKGYKWMTNDVGTKLVAPEKIKLLLYRGYRVVDVEGLGY
ncbi:hypothetical protein [Tenacibaculum finnmarkense]|uniref:hypothetical protein n=1 Tax=Tenacibaculum finnmarkense TaxID=2781243 RepID=UPI00207AB882|nr:hypothetical protein [Tenacibaculum finnmarkense]MCM8906810.1 hypothetical protein [Tenacibaculum finnmarkense genomovar finnmarkense]